MSHHPSTEPKRDKRTGRPYVIKAGSCARRIIDWMREQPADAVHGPAVLMDVGKCFRLNNVAGVMNPLVKHGFVQRFQVPGTKAFCYSMADQPHLSPRPWKESKPTPKKLRPPKTPHVPKMRQVRKTASVADLPRVEIFPGVFA